ncbi:MAG: hypothetical protein V4691_07205 [Pseudomonadota bacterium]
MDMRVVEIDMEVHKKLETARQSFSETENDILRRLLHMLPLSRHQSPIVPAPITSTEDWIWTRSGQRAMLPVGTEVRARYGGQEFAGVISKGAWVVEGKRFETPSEAIITLARTREGRQTNLNGWNLWEFRRPHETSWKPLKVLRA